MHIGEDEEVDDSGPNPAHCYMRIVLIWLSSVVGLAIDCDGRASVPYCAIDAWLPEDTLRVEPQNEALSDVSDIRLSSLVDTIHGTTLFQPIA